MKVTRFYIIIGCFSYILTQNLEIFEPSMD